MLHKDINHTGEQLSISEKEQRQSLCSNKTCSRCSFLASGREFSETSINSLERLHGLIKGIHARLTMEGWKIEPGKFTNPNGVVFYAKKPDN